MPTRLLLELSVMWPRSPESIYGPSDQPVLHLPIESGQSPAQGSFWDRLTANQPTGSMERVASAAGATRRPTSLAKDPQRISAARSIHWIEHN